MTIIRTLLEYAQSQGEGQYIHHPWQWLEQSDRPPLEKSWYAWVKAHVAMLQHDLNMAVGWLQTANELLVRSSNNLCLAEVFTSWSLLLDWADEPREAVQYAYDAWQRWYDFATNPQSARDLDSIRALMRVLASPDEPPDLHDEELYFEWVADRLTPQFLYSAKLYISLCGRLGLSESGVKVAEQLREWFDQYLRSGFLPTELTVFPYADLLRDVANLYDQVGEKERSLETFKKAIALLENSVDHPEVCNLRARLRFNAGNQLAKLGRYEEAVDISQAVQSEFMNLGDFEAAHRARHAVIVSRWHMQKLEGLREDLEDVLVDYETDFKQSESTDQQIGVRQNLDVAYRLWLTLTVSEIGTDERLAQRFLQQLYALREGFVNFASNWSRIETLDSKINVLTEIGILDSRLARFDGAVLLILESGVDRLILTTIKSGASRLKDRLRAELASEAFTGALIALLRLHQESVDALVDRAIAAKSSASEEFENSCRHTWQELPEGIRHDLAEARVLFVSPSNFGNLDEIPVELFHDGTDYIGLTRNIVRVTSLSQLLATLGENRVNVQPSGKGLIVRVADIEELGQLPHGDTEVRQVEKSLKSLCHEVQVLRGPSRAEMLTALGDGVDILHYIGHGFADETGEVLILSDAEDISARDLMSAGSAPAPVSIINSCLVGRARNLRTGEQQGVAVALLDQGAKVVVATIPFQMRLEDFLRSHSIITGVKEPSARQCIRHVAA